MMKNKIYLALIVVLVAAFAGYHVYDSQKTVTMSDLVLANVEALANTEYEIGAWGTNWKTYRIECTKTVGLDYGLVYTQTYTYWTDACGKGSGTCLSSAGC